MEADHEADRTLANKYEAVFCVFMAVLVYLWRDNSNLVYPQALYCFLLLLAFNLAAGLSLRLWPAMEWISTLFILANCGAITLILGYSGGGQSNLWVLYLLPIYTACLLLGFREVIWITAGAIGFNAAFIASETESWSGDAIFGLTVKSGIFIFTSAVTRSIVERDRDTKGKLRVKRMEIRELGELIDIQKAGIEESKKMADIGLLGLGVAHDLNNTFTAILGFADIALQDESLAPETRDDLESIRKSVLRGRDIVADFAKLSRKEKFPVAACDVNDVLRSVPALLAGALAQSGVKLSLELDEGAPPLLGNRMQLQRLLLSLVTNAVRAMKDGGAITLKAQVAGGPGRGAFQILIHVEATGLSIPDEVLANISRPIATAAGPHGETGLGLYICSQMAVQQGGRLHAENKRGGGARFTLHLPLM